MPVISIQNANMFSEDGNERLHHDKPFKFVASPGNILGSNAAADIVIDGSGYTLIPGLIDCKIDADASPSSLLKFVAAGVTTVIDSSSGTAESEAMRKASSQNPGWTSYLATGAAVGDVKNMEVLSKFPYRAVEYVSTPAEAEEFVAKRLSQTVGRADFIKAIADVPGLDDETLESVAAAAHRHGKLAIAQASQVEAYRRAVRAGFDVITSVPLDGELGADLIAEMARRDIAVVPTLSFIRHLLNDKEKEPASDFEHALTAVRQLDEGKVRICTGTAANQKGGLATEFGDSLHEEFRLMSRAGLSNKTILTAATHNPSKAFRLPDRGHLGEGCRSDILLVEGDPMEDLDAIGRIWRIWVQGIEFDRGQNHDSPGQQND